MSRRGRVNGKPDSPGISTGDPAVRRSAFVVTIPTSKAQLALVSGQSGEEIQTAPPTTTVNIQTGNPFLFKVTDLIKGQDQNNETEGAESQTLLCSESMLNSSTGYPDELIHSAARQLLQQQQQQQHLLQHNCDVASSLPWQRRLDALNNNNNPGDRLKPATPWSVLHIQKPPPLQQQSQPGGRDLVGNSADPQIPSLKKPIPQPQGGGGKGNDCGSGGSRHSRSRQGSLDLSVDLSSSSSNSNITGVNKSSSSSSSQLQQHFLQQHLQKQVAATEAGGGTGGGGGGVGGAGGQRSQKRRQGSTSSDPSSSGGDVDGHSVSLDGGRMNTDGVDRTTMTRSNVPTTCTESHLPWINPISTQPHRPQPGLLPSAAGGGGLGGPGEAPHPFLPGVHYPGVFRPPLTLPDHAGRIYQSQYPLYSSATTLPSYLPSVYTGNSASLSPYSSIFPHYGLYPPSALTVFPTVDTFGGNSASSALQDLGRGQLPHPQRSSLFPPGPQIPPYLPTGTPPGPSIHPSQPPTQPLTPTHLPPKESSMRRPPSPGGHGGHERGLPQHSLSQKVSPYRTEMSRHMAGPGGGGGKEGPWKTAHKVERPHDVHYESTGGSGNLKGTAQGFKGDTPSPKRQRTQKHPPPLQPAPGGPPPPHLAGGPPPPPGVSFPTHLPPPPPLQPVSTYPQPHFPPHFMKGSIIQLANGELKRVEDLRTEDFQQSADISSDLKIDSSTLVKVQEHRDSGTALLGFSVGEHKVQVTVEAALEHPFFVFGQGWSSISPERTSQRYGLPCQKLNVGDICISLTHKDVTSKVAELSRQSQPVERASVSFSTLSVSGGQGHAPTHERHGGQGYARLQEREAELRAQAEQTQRSSAEAPLRISLPHISTDSTFTQRKRRWSAPEQFGVIAAASPKASPPKEQSQSPMEVGRSSSSGGAPSGSSGAPTGSGGSVQQGVSGGNGGSNSSKSEHQKS